MMFENKGILFKCSIHSACLEFNFFWEFRYHNSKCLEYSTNSLSSKIISPVMEGLDLNSTYTYHRSIVSNLKNLIKIRTSQNRYLSHLLLYFYKSSSSYGGLRKLIFPRTINDGSHDSAENPNKVPIKRG